MVVRGNTRKGRWDSIRDRDIGYHVRVSDETDDPDWDAFVTRMPGGHHVQTSMWGQVKAVLGWRIARVVISHQDHIVAGAQLLIRPMPLIGAVGYVPKGPLCTSENPALAELVINELHRLSRVHRVQYLIVQPPNNGDSLARQLPRWGFRRAPIAVAPTATILIDLTQNVDSIMGQMRKNTRYNIRHSQRKSIIIREGTDEDLDTFYHLLAETSERQGFTINSKEYFEKVWQVFGNRYLKLFIAEYNGEPVSTLLNVAFHNTVTSWRGGWSGCYGNRHPNEAIRWSAIQWAKCRGYRYYDFGGIHKDAAQAIMRDEPLTASVKYTPTHFKLGFGGQVVLYPEPYSYVYNPLLCWAYNKVSDQIGNWPSVKVILNHLSKRKVKG